MASPANNSDNNKPKFSNSMYEELDKLEAAEQIKAKGKAPRDYALNGRESAMISVKVTEYELSQVRADYQYNRLATFLDDVEDKRSKVGKLDTSPWGMTSKSVRITVFEAMLLNEIRWKEGRKGELVSVLLGKTGKDLEDWKAASKKAAEDYVKNMKEKTAKVLKKNGK